MSKGKKITVGGIFCVLIILYLRFQYIEPAEEVAWAALETSILPIFTTMINFIPEGSPFLIPAILILVLVVLVFRIREVADVLNTVGDVLRSFLRLF